MAFWDADRGIAFSDSVDGRLVILRTDNGGRAGRACPPKACRPRSTTKARSRPAARTSRSMGAIMSGSAPVPGRSRGSCDRATADAPGRRQRRRSPQVRSSGIFSIAFRDADHGIVVGGDYRKESEAVDNAAITSDGGRTWTKVTGTDGISIGGVVSAGASTPTLLAVGPQGADQSTDDGRTWTPLPGASGTAHVRVREAGRVGWGAGENGRIMRLLY